MHSIALDGWRFIRNQGDGQEEVYDFVADPLERYDIAATDRGRELRQTLGQVLDSILAAGDSERRH